MYPLSEFGDTIGTEMQNCIFFVAAIVMQIDKSIDGYPSPEIPVILSFRNCFTALIALDSTFDTH
jgi:hypothetical protein